MAALDVVRFVLASLAGQRLRSALSALGVAMGVAAVVLLTSLGEGTRQYVIGQFTQFGTSLLAVNPGKVKTLGVPGVLGGTTHKLTIADAEALRRLPGVERVVPLVIGQARVESGGRGRAVFVYGVNHEATHAWQFRVAEGRFLPEIEPHRRGSFAVLGPKLARELFGHETALGQRVRIGGTSFVVVGVMEPKGQLLGFDLDDSCYIPVASAMALFNVDELNEIDILAASTEVIPRVVEEVRRILVRRHRGEEDFTITTQTEMLETFNRVIGVITLAVTAIAAISLVVGGAGILTVMWIAVHERTGEIGLLRALGVSRGGVQGLFLAEAILIALLGGLAGVGTAFALAATLRSLLPGVPLTTSPTAVALALAMSLLVGAASGLLPARRAAGLDPVEALRAE